MLSEDSAQGGGWRKSYAHVVELPALGCAWEFIRRNARICDAWSALRPTWQEVTADPGLKIVQATKQVASPYLWISAAEQDATTASVIWNPAVTDRVLDVVALPPKAAFGGQVLDLEFIVAEKTLFVSSDGTQQLLLRDGMRSLQLNITGASITDPVTLFVDTAVPEEYPDTQLHLLQCFRKLRISGALPADGFPRHPYARRAANVLLALDGHLAGIPHRKIATAMFGDARVERDWTNPGEHMRDTVRRAIARGLTLMEGGYRMFLR